jgi:hypothetical protein
LASVLFWHGKNLRGVSNGAAIFKRPTSAVAMPKSVNLTGCFEEILDNKILNHDGVTS